MISRRIKKKSIGIWLGTGIGKALRAIVAELIASLYGQLLWIFITRAPGGKVKGFPFPSRVPNSN